MARSVVMGAPLASRPANVPETGPGGTRRPDHSRLEEPVSTVLFDLDDTLFPQADWLDGAWAAVAAAAEAMGCGPAACELRRELAREAALGTDRGGLIDRALGALGAGRVPVAPLVEIFRAHEPETLAPYPGVQEGLAALRERGARLGLVTDGHPVSQRAKLRALGLAETFDVVVISDELGREHRKPDPAPFRAALDQLRDCPAGAVFVGDRPDKDVEGARRAGIRALRVCTGEYRLMPCEEAPWGEAPDVSAAIAALLELVGPR